MKLSLKIFGTLYTVLLVAGCASSGESKAADAPASAPKLIALTFDDGPSVKTEKLLQVLRDAKVKATFFLIGENIKTYADKAALIAADGHEIENHSADYAGLGTDGGADEATIRAKLSSTSAAIAGITGKNPDYFRAPNLDYSDTLIAVAGELGMPLIGTDVIGFDWTETVTTERIITTIMRAAHDGGIILLHERHDGDLERTIRAVPTIVKQLREQGYEILTVSELAARKGAALQAGVKYDVIK
jgi:peptidoglycan/xylan/chitin deacetylase (PgdA/CDA1 family)